MTDPTNTAMPPEGSREDIELLLPWYVNGTLEAADLAKVEDYLARHPDMAEQVATLREDMAEAIGANEAIAGPSGAALDRLMAQIEQEEVPLRRRAAQTGRSLMETIGDFLASLSPGRLGWAAMAAAAVIVLQAGVVGTVMLNPPTGGATYETASGTKAPGGTFVLVQFKPEAAMTEVSAYLAEHGAEIIAGPKPGGLYRVRISAEELAGEKRAALIDKLRGPDSVLQTVIPSQ